MLGGLERLVPAVRWLRRYRLSDLSRDASAGVVVAVILVPQGMAYALLAGLPPIYGLYASTVPALAYALFGTSRHMPVGPPALMALLTYAGVSDIARPGTGEYVALALLLALMAGVMQLGLGLLRAGFVANFISYPVLNGFVYASAVVIAVSQAGHLLGVDVSGRGSTLGTAVGLARRLDEAHAASVALGAGSLLVLALLPKVAPRLPAPFVVAAAGTFAVYLLGLGGGGGVGTVGDVPRGLPAFSVPLLDLASVRALVPVALTVAFVGFVESISVAKVIAAKEKYKIDADQELKALGLANVAAAFFSGFPVAGSFSRTAVNYQAGARTQVASVVSVGAILLTLLFLTPLFYYLPSATLAAIVLAAVYKLLDFREVGRVFRIRRADGYAMVVTFVVTLVLGVEQGILLGAAFALLAFVRRSAYPYVAELGYVEEEDAYLDKESFPEALTDPRVLIVRFDASFYFANISFLQKKLASEVARRPSLEWIIISCRGVNSVDVTAIGGLEDLISDLRSRGLNVLLAGAKRAVRENLRKAGWEDKFPNVVDHPTTREAVRAIKLSDGPTDAAKTGPGPRRSGDRAQEPDEAPSGL